MAMSVTGLWFLSTCLHISLVHTNVELYLHQNYKGLLQVVKTNSAKARVPADPRRSSCTNLNSSAPLEPKSVRLIDIDCVMMYETESCGGQTFRITSTGRDAIGKYMDNLGLRGIETAFVGSIRECDRWDGGQIVDVHLHVTSKNDPIKSFHSVCGCVDVPEEIQPFIRSLNNTGHCLLIYERTQCFGRGLQVPSGNIFEYHSYLGSLILAKIPKMKSFMPCDIPTHCTWKGTNLESAVEISFAEIGSRKNDDTMFFQYTTSFYLFIGLMLFVLIVITTLSVCYRRRKHYINLILQREGSSTYAANGHSQDNGELTCMKQI